jgi:hypothetical protein
MSENRNPRNSVLSRTVHPKPSPESFVGGTILMSTVPTAPATPRFSRTSVTLMIGGALVIIALIAAGFWLWPGTSHTSTQPSPAPVVSPAARPSGVPYYTKDEMEILRDQARQEERHKIALEQQYGK